MKVLIGCEFSATVREAFKAKGWDAWSVDLIPSELEGQHIVGDVLDHINDGWDMAIFFPPCTYLTNASSRWLYEDCAATTAAERWPLMQEGAEFFKKLLNAPIPKICVENPIMHKHALAIIGTPHTQTIQPYEFGDPASKRTCLWLKNLPKLVPTNILEPTWRNEKGQARWDNQTEGGSNIHGPSADRWKLRSKTFKGIAEGMAAQWG